jgi:hypothetical protein
MKSLRKVVVLCTMVTYSFSRGTAKTDQQIRRKLTIQAKKTQKIIPPDSTNQPPRITVWIHGTKSMSFISDFVHAVPHAGLKPIKNISSLYRIKPVMHALAQTDPERFPLEHFYAFGWSGRLCFKKRYQEAVKLHAALNDLVADYQTKYAQTPHITLITHSHGGNVALNIAAIPDKNPALRLELILLACPVQHETKEQVKDLIFERIYSFYSPADVMQIIDPQGLYTTPTNHTLHFELSERIFPIHPTVRQAELVINESGISHIGFILERTIKILPALLDALETWYQEEPASFDKEKVLEVNAPGWRSPSFSTQLVSRMKRMFNR